MPLSAIPNIFSLLEIVLRLRDNAHVFNRNVGGGLEFDANKLPTAHGDKHLPYAFVVPIDTIGRRVNRSEFYQHRDAILGIVICVDGTLHKAQGDGRNPVETVHSFTPLIAEIEDCLLNWRPVGFTLEDIPTFERLHPLGATENRAWVMLEYCIPYRFYHLGYGGALAAAESEANSLIRADKLTNLLVHYKAVGEFPTVVGEHYFDNVPLPMEQPTEEVIATFSEESEQFDINDAVRLAVAERGLDALNSTPGQTHDVPFNSHT